MLFLELIEEGVLDIFIFKSALSLILAYCFIGQMTEYLTIVFIFSLYQNYTVIPIKQTVYVVLKKSTEYEDILV